MPFVNLSFHRARRVTGAPPIGYDKGPINRKEDGMADLKHYTSPVITEFGSIDLTLGKRGSYPDGRSMNVMRRPKSDRGGGNGRGDDGGERDDD